MAYVPRGNSRSALDGAPPDLDWLVVEQELQSQLNDAPYFTDITDIGFYFTTINEILASPYYARGRVRSHPTAQLHKHG